MTAFTVTESVNGHEYRHRVELELNPKDKTMETWGMDNLSGDLLKRIFCAASGEVQLTYKKELRNYSWTQA